MKKIFLKSTECQIKPFLFVKNGNTHEKLSTGRQIYFLHFVGSLELNREKSLKNRHWITDTGSRGCWLGWDGTGQCGRRRWAVQQRSGARTPNGTNCLPPGPQEAHPRAPKRPAPQATRSLSSTFWCNSDEKLTNTSQTKSHSALLRPRCRHKSQQPHVSAHWPLSRFRKKKKIPRQ